MQENYLFFTSCPPKAWRRAAIRRAAKVEETFLSVFDFLRNSKDSSITLTGTLSFFPSLIVHSPSPDASITPSRLPNFGSFSKDSTTLSIINPKKKVPRLESFDGVIDASGEG